MSTNAGSAVAYPVVTIHGPGQLYHLKNYSTGDEIYFNLSIQSGEKVILDLRPGQKTLTSTFRGNLLPLGAILPGSDLATFRLLPGDNNLSLFIGDASAVVLMVWDNRFLSFDG